MNFGNWFVRIPITHHRWYLPLRINGREQILFFSPLVIKLAALYFARSGELIILVRQRSVNRAELNEIKFPEIAAQGFLNSSALLAVRCGKMRKAEEREKTRGRERFTENPI